MKYKQNERDKVRPLPKVVGTIPVLAVPVSMYRTNTYTSIKTPTFRTSFNIGQYKQKKKGFFLFFSFVIFEFL